MRERKTPQEKAEVRRRALGRRRANPYKTVAERRQLRAQRKAARAPYDMKADIAAVKERQSKDKAFRLKMRAAKTAAERELVRMERRAETNKRKRLKAWMRRQSRKDNPNTAEVDRLRHNEAMRKYMAKRRASDPVFADKCREANRLNMERRRAAAKGPTAVEAEVDET